MSNPNETAALLMAQMRGLPDKDQEQAAKDRIQAKVESLPTSAEIMRRARGSADYSEIHKSNTKAQREHEVAVRHRTVKLQREGMTSHFAEATAREQLRREDAQEREQAERRRVHEEMSANTRAEPEKLVRAAITRMVKPRVQYGPDGKPVRGTSYDDLCRDQDRDVAVEKIRVQHLATYDDLVQAGLISDDDL